MAGWRRGSRVKARGRRGGAEAGVAHGGGVARGNAGWPRARRGAKRAWRAGAAWRGGVARGRRRRRGGAA